MARRTLDVSHLEPFSISAEAPLWWGQVFLACIEATMFGILIAMYYYIRLNMDMWPPPGIQLPTRLQPSICLLLLILSCAGSYWASEAAKQNNRRGIIGGMVLNLVLAGAAMGMRALDWSTWNFKWNTTAYGSVVWGVMFLHTLDVVADLFFTLVLVIIFVRGKYGPRQRAGVHVDSVLWYFLVVIWIPIYITIYWGAYFVGAPS